LTAPTNPTPLNDLYLETVRDGALTWLYRLLFIFYAEDRNLLPVRDRRYEDYSLRKVRREIADRLDQNDTLSQSASRYDAHLKDLFRALVVGDASIGVPPYNGGLFESAAYPLLERVRLPDAVLAPLIDRLSRLSDKDRPKNINYRDLSVQHLGSIYERLLEYVAGLSDSGQIEIVPNIFARKGSGSYYTHDSMVRLIVEKAVGPLIEERFQGFAQKLGELSKSRRPRQEKLRELQSLV
jgi:hypothetical protein